MLNKKVLLSVIAIAIIGLSLGFLTLSGDDPTTAAAFSTFKTVDPPSTGDYLGTWTAGTAIPSPGSNGGAGVGYTRNDTCWLYALNGDIDGADLAPGTFRVYNITTNTWTALTSSPSGRAWTSMYKAGPVSNTILYDFGGLPTGATAWSQMTGSLFSYSINLGTWSTLATAPTPAGNAGVWSYQDSIIYAVGGVGTAGACLSTVQMYNIPSNTWRTCTSLPGTRANGWCFIKGDSIYYGSGCITAGSVWTNTIYVGAISQTNRATITWTTSAVTYPGANNEFMDAAPFGDGFIIGPGGSSIWWGGGTECYTWNGGTSAFVSVGPVAVLTSDAMLGSGSFQRGNYKIWKFVIASGWAASIPYHGLNTQIYTDSVLAAPPTPCSNFSSAWTTGLAVLPDGATNASRVIPSGIIINDTGYVYLMGGGSPVNINRCYNTVTNTWSTKTAMPIALATTNGTTIKDSIYIIGGYIGTGTSGAVYRYNPRTDSWATNAPMPLATNTADMCIVPWRDSLIICAGGGPGLFSSSAATTAVRYYNVYTNSWVDLSGSSLLPVAESMMASTIVGDTIYIFGGYTSANVTVGTAYRGVITPGSPISITWTQIASLPGTFNTTGKSYRSSGATIKSVNGGVLIVGGADDVGNYNGTAYLYNPCGNTYTTLTSATGSAKSNMGARLYTFKDSVIYLAGGYNAAGQTSVLKFAGRCYNCTVSGIVGHNGEIPEAYSLSQNYPNPFNPVTKINYSLPKNGLVTLKIYDVLGREVMTLVKEMKSAGNYAVDFNGANLSSGIYFYSLKSGDFTSVKKMTLIK